MASTDCGYCGRLAHMEAVSQLFAAPAGSNMTFIQAAYLCPNCQRLNLAGEDRDSSGVGPIGSPHKANQREWGPSVQWLPKRGDRRDFPDVPDHIAQAASEATLCASTGAYRAVGALARAIIEATAKDKQAEGNDLYRRIESLLAAGHIRKHTTEQAHEIRHFGNDMAHGDFIESVTQEEAEEIIELMGEVLDEVYQSPARLLKRRAARIASKTEPSES